MQTTKVQYYSNNIPWITCSVGSLLDLAIQDIIKTKRKKETERILKTLSELKPIKALAKSKSILYNSERVIND